MVASQFSTTRQVFSVLFLMLALVPLAHATSCHDRVTSEDAERVVRNEYPLLEQSILSTRLDEELTEAARQRTARLVDVWEVTQGGVKMTSPSEAIVESVDHVQQFRVAVDRSSGATYRLRGFQEHDVLSLLSDGTLAVTDSRSARLGAELAVLVALPGYFVKPVGSRADIITAFRGLFARLGRSCGIEDIRAFLDSPTYIDAEPSLDVAVSTNDGPAMTWHVQLSVFVGNAATAEIRRLEVRLGPANDLTMLDPFAVWQFPERLIADCGGPPK